MGNKFDALCSAITLCDSRLLSSINEFVMNASDNMFALLGCASPLLSARTVLHVTEDLC